MSPQAGRNRITRRRHIDQEPGAAPTGVVAIVGRPNVGKSTLFNRLVGGKEAIVDPLSGLTRDRLYGVCEWTGRRFMVIDTAGLDAGLADEDKGVAEIVRGTQDQARIAIQEADICLFVVDVRAGITGLDTDVANILRRGAKPTFLVGNKSDGGAEHHATELYGLGMGDPVLISALYGQSTGDLLDLIVDALPEPVEHEENPHELSIAIIGRPNVGKSSLLNAIVGSPRALVSAVAGTTRDAVDTVVDFGERRIRLVDTAGIRRRGVVDSNVEHYSLLRSLRALERSDVAIAVVDSAAGVTAQDRHVAGYAVDAGVGLVVAANKWDLVDPDQRASDNFLKRMRGSFDFVPGAPVITSSATEGRNVKKVVDAALFVAEQRKLHISTGPLNSLIRDAVDDHQPRVHKGRRLKILYATQARSATPTIVLFVNDPVLLHFSYIRYLENRIRAVYGFAGVRLRIMPRKRDEPTK